MTNREIALNLLGELGSVNPEWSDEHQAEIHEERHVVTTTRPPGVSRRLHLQGLDTASPLRSRAAREDRGLRARRLEELRAESKGRAMTDKMARELFDQMNPVEQPPHREPPEKDDLVERLREERDLAARQREQHTLLAAALNSKLEGEKRLSELQRERIAKLESVARAAELYLDYTSTERVFCASEYELSRTLHDALNALKDSGQPGSADAAARKEAEPTPPGSGFANSAQPGCSSLPCSAELLGRLARAKSVDIIIRKDGVERRYEADWLKSMAQAQRNVARSQQDSGPVNVAPTMQVGTQPAAEEGFSNRVAPSGGESGHLDNGVLGSQVIRDIVTVVLARWAGGDASAAVERLQEKYR